MKHSLKGTGKIFLSLLLCVVVAALSLPGRVQAQEQPFWNYSGKNYLYVNGNGGLTRVLTDSPGWFSTERVIFIEEYDSSLQLLSRHQVAGELSTFASFYAGAEYNYLVFGQENPNEDDSVEVIRVVKYSKNWERLGQASVCGANTTIPFRSGACRCAESGGMLYIHTCHQMYKSSDGKNHQANMTFIVRESDMVVTSTRSGVSYATTGYVSHSFDQHILADKEGNIVTIDLGDGYPRAVVLSRYNGMAGSEKLKSVSRATIQEIAGKIGDNRTGTSIGGFAETDSGYVTAYTYNGGSGEGVVYFAYTDKNGLSTRTMQLSAPGASVSKPRLVPTGTSGGYILWNDTTSGESILYYASYFADGSIGEFHAANASLGAWSPVFYNGKLVWTESTRANIKSGTEYDMIVNFYLLDDTGVEVLTMPAMYPYDTPQFMY